MNKFDIILPNEYGRKFTKRYKQYMYNEVQEIKDWNLADYGCGPTAIATILSSIGYDFEPDLIAQLMLLDMYGNKLDFYTNKETERLGMTTIGFLYLLQELKRKEVCNLDYRLVKFSYEHPELKKNEVIEMIKNEYMALILVGAKESNRDTHPRTFSKYGHYIAVTSVNNINNEFYIANSNKTGDNQIETTYSYEILVANMFSNAFDFLMIKNNGNIEQLNKFQRILNILKENKENKPISYDAWDCYDHEMVKGIQRNLINKVK